MNTQKIDSAFFFISIICVSLYVLSCATPCKFLSKEHDIEYSELVTVNTIPQGANIYLAEKYVGVSPVQLIITGAFLKARTYGKDCNGVITVFDTLDVYSATPVIGIITASLGGYLDKTQRLVIGVSAEADSAVKTVSVDPKDGAIWIPVSQHSEGLVGERTITISLNPEQTSFKAGKINQQQQNIIISEPEKEFGELLLSCNEGNAEINVDGVFVGNAPATLRLKSGIHIIEVNKPGYRLYRKEIRILSGSESSLRVELSRSN